MLYQTNFVTLTPNSKSHVFTQELISVCCIVTNSQFLILDTFFTLFTCRLFSHLHYYHDNCPHINTINNVNSSFQKFGHILSHFMHVKLRCTGPSSQNLKITPLHLLLDHLHVHCYTSSTSCFVTLAPYPFLLHCLCFFLLATYLIL